MTEKNKKVKFNLPKPNLTRKPIKNDVILANGMSRN